MGLLSNIKARRDATYVLSFSERRKLNNQLDSIEKTFLKVGQTVNSIQSLQKFYDRNSVQPARPGVRSPLVWSTFDHVMKQLAHAYREINRYPFKENDDVYPPYYKRQIFLTNRSIQVWVDLAVEQFGLREVLIEANKHITEEAQHIYIAHFGVMMHYVRKYRTEPEFQPLHILTSYEKDIVDRLIRYDEYQDTQRHFSKIRESEDLS